MNVSEKQLVVKLNLLFRLTLFSFIYNYSEYEQEAADCPTLIINFRPAHDGINRAQDIYDALQEKYYEKI